MSKTQAKKELSGMALKLKLQKKAIKYLQERYDKKKALANSDLWSPEEQIYNELKHFDGKDIMPNRDVPSPEEGILEDINKENSEIDAKRIQKIDDKFFEDNPKLKDRSMWEYMKDEKPLLEQLKDVGKGYGKMFQQAKDMKVGKGYSNKAKNAMKIAMKSQGKQDDHLYLASNGEEWEVNADEFEYLNSDKDGGQKEREGVIMKIGSGDINPETGRRRFFVITGTVLLAAAAVGAISKGVSGWNKRRKQRNALKTQRAEYEKKMVEAKKVKKEALENEMETQTRGREVAKLQSNQEFDTFANEASQSIAKVGDMAKKQKGLQTGVVAQSNAVQDKLITDAGKTKNTMTTMAYGNMDRQAKGNYSEIRKTSKQIMDDLKAGKANVNTAIKNTTGIMNFVEDGISGASTGLKFASTFGTMPGA